MLPTDKSSIWQAVSEPQFRLMSRLKFPQTKAGYVTAMFHPDEPTFPLDAEVISVIPPYLPGPLPTKSEDLA